MRALLELTALYRHGILQPMDVHLTPDVETIVRKRLQTGRYASASEVVNEALQALEERDRIRSKIADGLRSLEAGRGIAEDDAFEELKAKHEQYKHNRQE